MSLQQVPIGGVFLSGNEHLTKRGGFDDYSLTPTAVGGFDGKAITQRAQINGLQLVVVETQMCHQGAVAEGAQVYTSQLVA